MESLIKRLMSGRPHIWLFNGTWRAAQALMMDSNGQSAATMEVFGNSPVEAGVELQSFMLHLSEERNASVERALGARGRDES